MRRPNGVRVQACRQPLRFVFQPAALMFWRAFALIGNDARRGGGYAGGSSTAAGFLPLLQFFFSVFFRGWSLGGFFPSGGWGVDPYLVIVKAPAILSCVRR